MRVTILGSGTCTPQLNRSASAVLVQVGSSTILLDLGPGTMRRLLENGVTIGDLTHIAITHFHPDHTGELVPLLFATKYAEAPPRSHQLTLIGGTGLMAFYHGLRNVFGEWIVLPHDLLKLREIDVLAVETIDFKDFVLTARPVAHRPESLAYRITGTDGTTIVCSGDTDYCQSLVDLAQGADLFICEAAKPEGMKVPGHLTPSLAGNIAAEADVKQLVLTHLYPSCDAVDIVKQAATAYKGPVMAAEDCMRWELPE